MCYDDKISLVCVMLMETCVIYQRLNNVWWTGVLIVVLLFLVKCLHMLFAILHCSVCNFIYSLNIVCMA